MDKNKLVSNFVIGTFVTLYLLVSIISTIHVIDFFELSNPYWLAVTLAIGFEIGAAASLASLVILKKMNKTLVWALFITITLMQMQGNMYYAFINMDDFNSWAELFALIEEEPIFQKRVLSAISGAILPLVALGFIKSLVDYIKPEEDEDDEVRDAVGLGEDLDTEVEQYANMKAAQRDHLAEMMKNDQELGLYDEPWVSENPLKKDPELEDWDITLEDGLEDEDLENFAEVRANDREKFVAEESDPTDEWDEDHAHDMAMNAMLEGMTEEEIDALSEGLSGGHEYNNPTSVGEMVKPIIEEQEEKVQVIKKKVEDLKKEVTTKEDAIEILGLEIEDEDLSEEELYRRAMDKKAKEEMKQFISKKNDND